MIHSSLIRAQQPMVKALACLYACGLFTSCSYGINTMKIDYANPSETEDHWVTSTSTSTRHTINTHHAKKFAVLLLHGAFASDNELDPIQNSLKAKFGDAVTVIQPTSRAEHLSIQKSVYQQADDVYQEIMPIIMPDGEVPQPLFIIGYSQGGMVACLLAKRYGQELDLKGVITINAPLKGVPVLSSTPSDITAFFCQGEAALEKIYNHLPSVYQQYNDQGSQLPPLSSLGKIKKELWWQAAGLKYLVRAYPPFSWIFNQLTKKMTKYGHLEGLKDMFPHSKASQDIEQFMETKDMTTPFVLIGGYQDQVSVLFDPDPETTMGITASESHSLNIGYTQSITRIATSKHDTLIPLKSQLCRGDSLDNITLLHQADDPDAAIELPISEHRTNRLNWIYSNVAHAGNLIAIDSNLYITNAGIRHPIYDKRIIADLLSFIQTKTQSNL